MNKIANATADTLRIKATVDMKDFILNDSTYDKELPMEEVRQFCSRPQKVNMVSEVLQYSPEGACTYRYSF